MFRHNIVQCFKQLNDIAQSYDNNLLFRKIHDEKLLISKKFKFSTYRHNKSLTLKCMDFEFQNEKKRYYIRNFSFTKLMQLLKYFRDLAIKILQQLF
jgi:hypothetical protein